MKAWITKYALTAGIQVVDAQVSSGAPGMVSYLLEGDRFKRFAHGKEWWHTEEDAISRAEAMRQAKIASLNKQIAKLEKMKIEVKQ